MKKTQIEINSSRIAESHLVQEVFFFFLMQNESKRAAEQAGMSLGRMAVNQNQGHLHCSLFESEFSII